MQKPHKSVQIFKNPLLERFTHVHPLTPLIVWAPFVGWLIWRSYAILELSSAEVASYGAFGFFVWTLAEYILHRFVFHYEAESQMGKRFHFLIHGIHHVDPNDATRLVMPPSASIILALGFYGLFRALLGPLFVQPFFAFFVLGYLCYDYTHYSVHHFIPRTRVGKYLKHSHMLHHYVDHHTRWGVSSPLWDVIFGTMGTREVKANKEVV